METVLPIALSLGIAYLLGAIPTGYLCGKILKGIDIRQHGSKNMGATNVFRVLGKGPGIAVLLIDIAKGIIPVTVVANALGLGDPLVLVLIGAVSVAGHNWTVFLGFKGGKGVATSLGVIIGLAIQISGIRPVLFLTVGIWLVLFLLFGYVSLASMIAAVALPILMVSFNAPFPIIILSMLLCVFIVIRHRSNLSRLLKGQENRIQLPWTVSRSQ
jgi:acyl phosphate:glycerol-3-phosphate acyltransferase